MPKPVVGRMSTPTAEVGHFSNLRTENKGKINKRLYIRLGDPPQRISPAKP